MGIHAVVERMRAVLDQMATAGDARRHFLAVYLRTTEAVEDERLTGGFRDSDWVERWDVAFAGLYFDALERADRGDAVPGPWSVAFALTGQPPLRHVLAGMNAHVNYDLPQALLAVIPSTDFDDLARMRLRQADHRHVDAVLTRQVAAEGADAMRRGTVSRTDRVLRPLNELATRRFLREAREKVWANAVVLDAQRRTGRGDGLAELERRSAERVRALCAPGPVLLKLAVGGFGVVLPGAQVQSGWAGPQR
jgi:hypothetical protein